jgi:hypothetical protein
VRSCATNNRTVFGNENKPLHVLCRVATIAVTTAAVRTLMLPVVVYQMKNTARMSVSLPPKSSTSGRKLHHSVTTCWQVCKLGASIC